MAGVVGDAEVTGALGALARASRSLSGGADPETVLAELVEAVASGTGAEAVAAWLPDPAGYALRAIWSSSAGLAAELEGMRAATLEEGVAAARARIAEGAETYVSPFDAAQGRGGLQLVRRDEPFGPDETLLAAVAADLAGLATRLGELGLERGEGALSALDLVGDALAAVAEESGTEARLARLAVVASGADAALVWRAGGERLLAAGAQGAIAPSPELEGAADELLEEGRAVAVSADAEGRQVVSLQLGQPALGVIQLRLPQGRVAGEVLLAKLSGFAVRAAHALRSSERAQEAGLELERSRALLAVVGEAISQLSLSHTLDTAIERVADLLGADRVAVYLRSEQETSVAACRGIEGPHEQIADALLAAALGSRRGGALVEVPDAAGDERLEAVRPQLEEAGIGSALAFALVVGDEPIGLLAAYPSRPRALTESERSLLTALAAQLAVAVQNARLHEQATALGAELEETLRSERETARRLSAHYDISRSFAQSLSLEKTLDVLAESIVTLLGVDAAVIRMPDERGLELVARAVHLNDERVDAAGRALLSRPQRLPRQELAALLESGRPLLLDAERAEGLGGALALLAPFLRKGSSAALIPIVSSGELLAILTIVSLHPGRPVEGEVTETALSIAGQAALAIDNARLYGQQKAFADTMQRSLLPRETPEVSGMEVGAVYESAARVEVGGDVYDYLELADGRLAVVLGDVTGHGVDAAADMAMAKFVFRSLARERTDPGAFLAAANDVVASEIAPGRFITMVELVLDAERGEVICASGGHPPPRLVLPDGTVESIEATGLALGIDAPQEYRTVTRPFPPGASVVAYTDGVIEARNDGVQFGIERLDELLSARRALPPRVIAEAALAACREWTGGELTDDFALVVITRTGAA